MTRKRGHELGFVPVRPASVAADAVMTAFRVPPELAGMRLDRFVQSELKRTSRTRAQLIVRVSAFSPEGKSLRPSDRVRAEDHVLLWRAPWDEEVATRALTVLFEDEHFLAIDKPPNVPVHPSARYHRSTVVKLLEVARPDEHLYLAHRLDKETSGALLLARTAEADRAIKRVFAGLEAHPSKRRRSVRDPRPREIEKVYLAIARGHVERDAFASEQPLEEDPTSSLRVKMRVAAPGEGLTARTRFEVIERRARPSTGAGYTLLRCALETGRQHQIRVHLMAEGHPIVGDKLYGDDDRLFARGADGELTDADLEHLELPRHALHAHRLALDHPMIEGARIEIEAPLPDDLADFWAGLARA